MASAGLNGNKEKGKQAESWVADHVNGERDPNAWFDVETRDGGIIEVKSTVYQFDYEDRYGRFRLWKDQHEKLKDADGEYWLLVETLNPAQADPEDIDDVIAENDLSWTNAGHQRDEQQIKIPWTHFEDLAEQKQE